MAQTIARDQSPLNNPRRLSRPSVVAPAQRFRRIHPQRTIFDRHDLIANGRSVSYTGSEGKCRRAPVGVVRRSSAGCFGGRCVLKEAARARPPLGDHLPGRGLQLAGRRFRHREAPPPETEARLGNLPWALHWRSSYSEMLLPFHGFLVRRRALKPLASIGSSPQEKAPHPHPEAGPSVEVQLVALARAREFCGQQSRTVLNEGAEAATGARSSDWYYFGSTSICLIIIRRSRFKSGSRYQRHPSLVLGLF